MAEDNLGRPIKKTKEELLAEAIDSLNKVEKEFKKLKHSFKEINFNFCCFADLFKRSLDKKGQ